jgi:hypothetical protein
MEREVQQTKRFGSAQRRGQRGQAFTELAISLLFLLILMSVMIDLGWAFYTLIALRDAAQEAASYGAICPFEEDNLTANTALIRERLRLSATAPIDMRDIDLNDIEIWFTDLPDPADPDDLTAITTPVMGGNIVVRVTIQHKIMTPFAGAFIGTQEYPLTVQIADTVMRSKWLNQCQY